MRSGFKSFIASSIAGSLAMLMENAGAVRELMWGGPERNIDALRHRRGRSKSRSPARKLRVERKRMEYMPALRLSEIFASRRRTELRDRVEARLHRRVRRLRMSFDEHRQKVAIKLLRRIQK